jgi:tetratricopeptide (TPR) repeat protein
MHPIKRHLMGRPTADDSSGPEPATFDERLQRAREAERSGDSAAAIQEYGGALAALSDSPDDPRAADALRFLGSVHRERGEIDRAERRYRESYAHASRLGYRDGIAHACNWLGVIALGRGRMAEAEALFTRAGEVAEETNNQRLVGAIEQNLGILTNIRGDLAAALAHYQKALGQFAASSDGWMVGIVLNNLGLVYSDLRQWDEATAALDEAHESALRHGNWMLENSVEVNRAELHIARGEWDLARAACERARSLAQLRSDQQREAETLKFQGVIARESEAHDEAQRLLTEAEALAIECDDRLLMAEVARELGDLQHRLGRRDEARIAYARALDLFQAMGARRDYGETEDRFLATTA